VSSFLTAHQHIIAHYMQTQSNQYVITQ